MSNELSGVLTALSTPFNQDETIDVDSHGERDRHERGQITLGADRHREIGRMEAGHVTAESPVDLLHQPFRLGSHLFEPCTPTVETGAGGLPAAAAGGLPPQP